MIYDDTVTIGTSENRYEVIAKAGEYGYDWTEMALLRRNGELFFAIDSGCSCYSFGEYGLDLQPVGTVFEAIVKAKEEDRLDEEFTYEFVEACLRARREGRV